VRRLYERTPLAIGCSLIVPPSLVHRLASGVTRLTLRQSAVPAHQRFPWTFDRAARRAGGDLEKL